ncbi:endo-1,4-beta-xylanase [Novipirellula artificiosorum]|uniref:Beta-xylanase n=1 Tax=Novipirellula artificiosorum TaxID=2528016 RepID=A0A5C6DZH5_9BACT|nr:endo-1,4-beta-xylanase [Novipirellula artificiosorum]TWU40466.1 Endo-1,4-beta-xylanase/feruloyl esterase precursor [Novipirellula artificiosorum]
MMRVQSLFCAGLQLFVLSVCVSASDVTPADPADLYRDADARIEKYRKADVSITVLDSVGQPVSGAEVHLQQTRHAFLFGSNIFTWQIEDAPNLQQAYRGQFTDLLNFATAGFYWPSYEPAKGKTRFEDRAACARWCQQQGIVLKGHPLAWNYSDPRWIPDDSKAIFAFQLGRITDCVTRFNGLINTWDVVNEPTHVDRQEFKDRAPKMTRMWMDVGQIEFAKSCFEAARKANPEATLLVNDYRVDEPYAEVIRQLVDADGKPLYDKIGIQSHQHGGAWSNEKIWETCERFAAFGVPLHFTETTILSGERKWRADEDRTPWPSTDEGEAYQSKEVERFYTMLYSHPSVEAITWWDFSDYHAWKRAPAGLLRDDMTAKPAYHTLMSLIHDKWWTEEQLMSGPDGKAACRATYGDYEVTVTRNGKSPVVVRATVAREQERAIVVRLP